MRIAPYRLEILRYNRVILFLSPDSSSPRSPRSSDGTRDDLSALIPSPSNYPKSATAIRRLRLENERLQAEVTRLRRLVVSGATSVLSEKKTPTENSDPSSKTHALEMELQLAKEALTSKSKKFIYCVSRRVRIYSADELLVVDEWRSK